MHFRITREAGWGKQQKTTGQNGWIPTPDDFNQKPPNGPRQKGTLEVALILIQNQYEAYDWEDWKARAHGLNSGQS